MQFAAPLFKGQARLSLCEFQIAELEADLSWHLLTSNTPQSCRLSPGSGYSIVWHLLFNKAALVVRVTVLLRRWHFACTCHVSLDVVFPILIVSEIQIVIKNSGNVFLGTPKYF